MYSKTFRAVSRGCEDLFVSDFVWYNLIPKNPVVLQFQWIENAILIPVVFVLQFQRYPERAINPVGSKFQWFGNSRGIKKREWLQKNPVVLEIIFLLS